MDNFFSVIIILGALLLVASLKTTFKVCKKTSQRAWSVLLCAIVCFILGYWWILYYFSNYDTAPIIRNAVATILFGGAGFVFLVVKLSLKSILKIEQATQYQKYQTEHDNLTTLPNRNNFFKSLSKQVDYPSSFALFYIDLNNFKQINDAFGHQCGDQLLAAFANKLSKELCGIAKLYRIGGMSLRFY
ncbi:GGDEF domain-containing protein [Pseudoalteromonas sp. B137]